MTDVIDHPGAPTWLDTITEAVTLRTGTLESPAEAVAIVESLGVTDANAAAQGYSDVFMLGLAIFEHQTESPLARERRDEVEAIRREESLDKRSPSPIGRFLPRFAFKGLTFGLPQLIMIVAVLTLLYSLWAFFFFDVQRASAIGVGTVGSYIVTAGFMQAIGRRGLMYLRQDMQVLSLKISLLLIGVGIGVVTLAAILFWALLLVFPIIASKEIPTAVLYFSSLSLLWLGLSIVYMVQQELWFSFAIALGIFVVYVCQEYIGLSIMWSQQLGLWTSAIAGLVVGTLILLLKEQKLRRNRKEPLAGALPRLSVIAYSVAPYFTYGLLYFSFLFTDRVMAWTGRTSFRQSFVWFQTDYEVGLNWALISLVLSLGVLEFTVYRLGEYIPYYSERFSVAQFEEFANRLKSFYRRAVVAFLISAVVGTIGAYLLVQFLVPRIDLIDQLLNEISVRVFLVASASYLFVVWALLNNVFIFSFSRPSFALRAVVPALVTNVFVGFVLSRMLGYWWAVFGLFAGAVVYWALSTFFALRMLRRMDYYAYSSF